MEKLWFLCLGKGGSAAGVWLSIKHVDCLALCGSHGRSKAAWVVKASFLYFWSSLEAQRKKDQPKAFTTNHVFVWCNTVYTHPGVLQITGVSQGTEVLNNHSVVLIVRWFIRVRQISEVASYLRPLFMPWSSVSISVLTLCVVGWIMKDFIIINGIMTPGEATLIFPINHNNKHRLWTLFLLPIAESL